jgi:predicted DNA-binding protein
MSELSQTINIRTTFEMKKRILDNAEKKGMNQSEYILFAVESYLKNVNNPAASQTNNEVDNSQITLLQVQLDAANQKLKTMEDHVVLEKKSIWQEATDLANRITSEKIQQAQSQAVREYQEKYREEMDLTNQQFKMLQDRLFAYETPLLKQVFQFASQNHQIRDYPDVVYFLVHCYSKQINPTQYAIGQ